MVQPENTSCTEQKNPALQAVADYSQDSFENLRGSRPTDAASGPGHRQTLQANHDLTDTLAALNALKTQPRGAIIDGKTTRASQRVEFAELGTLLQHRLMRQLRAPRPGAG